MSAIDDLHRMLDQYGLGILANWAWSRWQEGASIDQILIELYDRPEFNAVYPEYKQLAAKGRAYSVAELAAYRKAAVGLMRSYGIPTQFYDQPEDLARLAAAEVSIAELSQRVSAAAELVYSLPSTVRDEMNRLWGIREGDLMAFWLDPDRSEPIIRQQYTAAQAGAAAKLTGFGELTREEARRAATAGLDLAAYESKFANLGLQRELFAKTAMGEEEITRAEQLGAAFESNTEAVRKIERRREQRKAEFAAGGGYSATREGFVGTGVANQ
jgi:hypothetical protein